MAMAWWTSNILLKNIREVSLIKQIMGFLLWYGWFLWRTVSRHEEKGKKYSKRGQCSAGRIHANHHDKGRRIYVWLIWSVFQLGERYPKRWHTKELILSRFFVRQGAFPQEYWRYFKEMQRSMTENQPEFSLWAVVRTLPGKNIAAIHFVILFFLIKAAEALQNGRCCKIVLIRRSNHQHSSGWQANLYQCMSALICCVNLRISRFAWPSMLSAYWSNSWQASIRRR